MFISHNKKTILTGLFIFVVFFVGFSPRIAEAQYDQVKEAFVLSPTKHEVRLGAGESVIRNIYITNKLGRDADFVINIEDISGSNVDGEIIKYYGQGLGPYSIRNYIIVENDHIRVANGETKVVPMLISLPAKVKPGGLYGGVFVSVAKTSTNKGPNISSRAGSLIFLRVKGNVEEKGEVTDFSLSSGRKVVWTRSPVDFRVSFENKGNIYLNPYGVIEIKNWRGQIVDRLPIEPWFVFSDSIRTRLVNWNHLPLFGYFTASLVLNHGYTTAHATTIDLKFLVIPLPLILGLLVFAGISFVVYKTIRKIKKWQI